MWPKGNFSEILPFLTGIISENIKIYPHNLPKKGIPRSYYVNIFFKMNTLSAERCPFFAWILTSKKSIFATFSAHFSPHASPRSFSLSEGILRTRHPPSKSLAFPPFIFPFRGQPSQANSQAKPTGRVSVKTLCFLQKSHTFYCKFQLVLAWERGDFRGGVGEKFRDFSSEASLWKGENWGTFGGGLGEKWGKNRTFLSISGTLRNHVPPCNSPAFSPVFFLFQSVREAEFIPKTRRFRSKLKPFRGESSPAQGRREGLFRGILGWKQGETRMQFEYFGSKNLPHLGRFWG